MANFLTEYERGKTGRNYGLDTGLPQLNRSIDGIQRKSIYTFAAGPKVGKTMLVDFAFVLSPYLIDVLQKKATIHWTYFSYEIDRVRKEFKFAAFFMAKDHGIYNFEHNNHLYQMSSRYLTGKLKDKVTGEPIHVFPQHEELLKQVYNERIIPLFGRWHEDGHCIEPGLIDFIEQRDNPTGIMKYLKRYAEKHGTFKTQAYEIQGANGPETKHRPVGYVPHDEESWHIVITDHMRKPMRERGFTLKENIDKLVEYQVEFRNWCHWIFVDIIHLNRAMASIDRIKFNPEFLYPTGDDVKDTGNLSEESDYIFTLFNPKDEKFKLRKHFGHDLSQYEYYRSLHLVESRETDCPMHMGMEMFGATNIFKGVYINKD